MDVGVHEPLQTHEFQKVFGLFPTLRRTEPFDEFQTEQDISQHREPGKQRRLLKHHQSMWSRPADRLAIGLDRSTIRPVEARDQVQ